MRQYIRLNLQFAERDIAEKRAALIRHRIDIAKRGVAAGLMTQMQLLETQTALPMALAQIEHVDEQIALSRNQLAALSGQGPGAGDDIMRPTLTLNAPIGLPDRLPANLVGRRPDVIAHRWHVEAAGLSIESAKAAFYPDINLIAFAGFQALGFGQLISGASAIAGVGPAFSLPIFDGGRRRGNLSAKDALYDIAVEQYNETVIHALQDVADQLVILESNAKQRAQADEAMALATRAHALAQKSYLVGLENYLHVLDTQAVLTNHEEAIARLYAVRLDAHAKLMQALGGGVEDLPIAVTTMPVEKSGE
jgi:NodT family efflux transporter outer membrane factor (OMF) lipoprotein